MSDRKQFSKHTGPEKAGSPGQRVSPVWLVAAVCAAQTACGEIVPVDRPDATPAPDAAPVDSATMPDAVAADNANLSDLRMSAPGELSPAFDPEVTEYTAGFSILVQQLRVTPTAVHPEATITVNDIEVQQGQASDAIPLIFGLETTITIEVTAPAGNSRTYTLTASLSAPIEQAAYGKASNPGGATSQAFFGDNFGFAIDMSGDTLVVGAHLEDSDATGVNGAQDNDMAQDSGAVYVFRRIDGAWEQEAYIKASNTNAGDQFGISVAIDGEVLVVGATGEASSAAGVSDDPGDQNNNSLSSAGAAYVFRRAGSEWTQEAYVKASDPAASAIFGFHVDVDGDTLVAGAPGVHQGDPNLPNAGAVYVFRHDGSAWAQEARLQGSNTEPEDRFGIRFALDGDVLAVGAVGEASANRALPDDDTAFSAGAVYVFEREGVVWREQDYVKPDLPGGPTVPEVQGDLFGAWVALDGDTLVVGASQEDSSASRVDGNPDNDDALNSGAVYVFRRDGSAWSQEAYIKPGNTTAGDLFGDSVAVSGDLIAVSSFNEDGSASGVGGTPDDSGFDTGAAYLFQRVDGVWEQAAYIKASNPQGEDRFGFELALSPDTLVVGARFEDGGSTGINGNQGDEGAFNSGAFYLFN